MMNQMHYNSNSTWFVLKQNWICEPPGMHDFFFNNLIEQICFDAITWLNLVSFCLEKSKKLKTLLINLKMYSIGNFYCKNSTHFSYISSKKFRKSLHSDFNNVKFCLVGIKRWPFDFLFFTNNESSYSASDIIPCPIVLFVNFYTIFWLWWAAVIVWLAWEPFGEAEHFTSIHPIEFTVISQTWSGCPEMLFFKALFEIFQ